MIGKVSENGVAVSEGVVRVYREGETDRPILGVTDEYGHFQFFLSPGKYVVSAKGEIEAGVSIKVGRVPHRLELEIGSP